MKSLIVFFGLMVSMTSFAQNRNLELRCHHSLDMTYESHLISVDLNNIQKNATFYFNNSSYKDAKEVVVSGDQRSMLIRLQGETVYGKFNPNARVEILLTSPIDIFNRGARIEAKVRHYQTRGFAGYRAEEYLECHHN